jgi:hypothetical protein
VFGYQQKQVVSVTSVVYDPKSTEVLASPVPATTRAAVELFPWQQKALQPHSVTGPERTG